MRVVVYDDELEPITVINLPGMTTAKLERHGRHWRIPIPELLSVGYAQGPAELERMSTMRIATLTFERIRRGNIDGLWCFTKDVELLLETEPDWLPGQRREVNHMVRENQMLSRIIGRMLMG